MSVDYYHFKGYGITRLENKVEAILESDRWNLSKHEEDAELALYAIKCAFNQFYTNKKIHV